MSIPITREIICRLFQDAINQRINFVSRKTRFMRLGRLNKWPVAGTDPNNLVLMSLAEAARAAHGSYLGQKLILPVESMSIPWGLYEAESSGMFALTPRFANSRKNNSRMRGSSSSNSICTPPVCLYLAPEDQL